MRCSGEPRDRQAKSVQIDLERTAGSLGRAVHKGSKPELLEHMGGHCRVVTSWIDQGAHLNWRRDRFAGLDQCRAIRTVEAQHRLHYPSVRAQWEVQVWHDGSMQPSGSRVAVRRPVARGTAVTKNALAPLGILRRTLRTGR